MNLSFVIREHFPFEPTPGQQLLIEKLSAFVVHPDNRRLFVLKGYAGTGKTTVVSALVKSLPAVRWKFVLLAPTGRAAKVLADYSQWPAFTIHKKNLPAKDRIGWQRLVPAPGEHAQANHFYRG